LSVCFGFFTVEGKDSQEHKVLKLVNLTTLKPLNKKKTHKGHRNRSIPLSYETVAPSKLSLLSDFLTVEKKPFQELKFCS
jgi:hypothetical protein